MEASRTMRFMVRVFVICDYDADNLHHDILNILYYNTNGQMKQPLSREPFSLRHVKYSRTLDYFVSILWCSASVAVLLVWPHNVGTFWSLWNEVLTLAVLFICSDVGLLLDYKMLKIWNCNQFQNWEKASSENKLKSCKIRLGWSSWLRNCILIWGITSSKRTAVAKLLEFVIITVLELFPYFWVRFIHMPCLWNIYWECSPLFFISELFALWRGIDTALKFK